jgi:acetyl-CoA acetyltransferase
MIARRHMHEYGTTREQIAQVAVKNHKHGALNPKAQFQREVSLETVLRSPPVADPLGVFDCAPNSDGAAAVVLCAMEKAKKYTDTPIKITASAQASDTLALHHRTDICTFDANKFAAARAFKQAKMNPKDVDVAEINDNFTISEILAIEDIGFFKKGEGGKATEEGQTTYGGKVVVNSSGGLKARGDPIGATGVAQIVEIVTQLRGEAGKRQVPLREYKKNLKRSLSILKKTSARTVWVRTTHVDDRIHNSRSKGFLRFNRDVKRYNRTADGIMKAAGIPEIDLNGFTRRLKGRLFIDHVHFTKRARKLQAGFLARSTKETTR